MTRTVLGQYQPEATAHGVWQLTTCDRPTSRLGHGLTARSSRGGGPRRGNGHAPGVPTAWSPCTVHARDDAVARSPVARCCRPAPARFRGDAGWDGEGRGSPERRLDVRGGGGGGGTTTFNGGRGAPGVSGIGDGVLQHRRRGGKVRCKPIASHDVRRVRLIEGAEGRRWWQLGLSVARR
jgi:hypothetical protein